MKNRSWKRGFTLIELLVVVAIIVALIAILMPSLSNARNQARAVKCMSNLKQLGGAIYMYAQENNGTIPIASQNKAMINPTTDDWTTNLWMIRLYPYVNITPPKNYATGAQWRKLAYGGVFSCPSKYDLNFESGDETYSISYAYNGFYFDENGYLLKKNGVEGLYMYYQKLSFLDPRNVVISDAHLVGLDAWAVLRSNTYLYDAKYLPMYHAYGHNMLFPGGDVQRTPVQGVTWSLKNKR